MTSFRDDDSLPSDPLRSEDETRIDLPVAADDAPPTSPYQRPSQFPNVGGAPAANRPLYAESTFTPARDEPSTAAPVSVATSPVVTPPVGGRRGRWRWIAASVATLTVLAVVAGILFFGAQPSKPSLVAQYAPANTVAYVEVRLDLPGDQRDRLVSLLGNFPGFADPASFQLKVDDTLASALRMTGSGLDWKADVEPWFGGQVGFFVSSLAPTNGVPQSLSIVLSVKDRTRLDQLVAERATGAGMQQEEYKGQTIWSGNATDMDQSLSLAVTDEALVVSTRNEDLKAALDARSGAVAGLADDAYFTGQVAQLHADRLALFYYDYSSVLDSMPSENLPDLPAGCLDGIRAAANLKMVAEVRAESDHLAMNTRSQFPSGANLPPAPQNKRTGLADRMPNGTLAYMEMRELGAGIKYLVGQVLSCIPAATEGGFDIGQIEQLIGTAPQDYFDFLDDAAIGFTFTDGKPGGGIIATVDDENLARSRVNQLLAAARLAAGPDSTTKIEEVQHGDASITVISFESPFMPPGEVPSVAVSVHQGRVYLGLNDFVTAAIDRQAADSLATTPRLQQAISAVGAENAGVMYVDIASIRALIEAQSPAEGRGQYDTEVKPFIEPITHLISVSRNESGVNVSHTFLYVE